MTHGKFAGAGALASQDADALRPQRRGERHPISSTKNAASIALENGWGHPNNVTHKRRRPAGHRFRGNDAKAFLIGR